MTQLEKLLDIAIGELGVVESPPNSNTVKYNTWYYKHQVSGLGYPWCMVFCQWVYNKAGISLPSNTASCTAMLEAAKKKSCFVDRLYKPGDLLLFNFDGKKTVSTHCGICKESNQDGSLISIEGNTSIGNDTNGGSVMMRKRQIRHVVGAVRPTFSRKDELDMTKEEFLKSLSDKEAYELFKKASSYAEKLPEPAESKKEGWWAKFIKMGVINTNTPEAVLKRDELALILGRLGLL